MRTFIIGAAVAAALAGGVFIGRSITPPPARPAASPAAAARPEAQKDDEQQYKAAMADARAAAAVGQYTKVTFAKAMQGKTKAQVVAALGQPDSVFELTDYQEWHYSNLSVFDAEAGIQVAVGVDFPRGADFVDQVHY